MYLLQLTYLDKGCNWSVIQLHIQKDMYLHIYSSVSPFPEVQLPLMVLTQ